MATDLQELLAQAPTAVDSYFPRHWERMRELEQRAQRIVALKDRENFVRLLCDVAFLKQPWADHTGLLPAIEKSLQEVNQALDAFGEIERLDYRAMELLAKVPGFGRGGGRAFNSAVMRLVCPQSFGIIDWRNLAVLMSAPGFEGLIDRPFSLEELSGGEVLRLKGRLVLTQQVYERYNNALRAIARSHAMSVAEVDLALWTFSILRQPFSPFQARR